MNKQREALLKEILAEPDAPRKVAYKNLVRFVDRMSPETQEMRDFLMAVFGAETRAESSRIEEIWLNRMTPAARESFSAAFSQCLLNQFSISEKVVEPVAA
jgi:hypothetical protein